MTPRNIELSDVTQYSSVTLFAILGDLLLEFCDLHIDLPQ
jgi:hypothetical protein